jgi:hypothetical protein
LGKGKREKGIERKTKKENTKEREGPWVGGGPGKDTRRGGYTEAHGTAKALPTRVDANSKI